MTDFKLTEEEKGMILLSRKIEEQAAKRGKLNKEFILLLFMVEGIPTCNDAIDNMAAMSVLFFKKNPELKEKFLDLAYEVFSKADE